MKPSYIRAFSTLGSPDSTLEDMFALARKHRIDSIELRALGGTIDLPAYFTARGVTPEKLAETVRESGLRIGALGASLRLITGKEEDRESFLRFVPWAEALNVPLRVFDGGKSGDEEEMACAVSTLEWWRRLRAERGLRATLLLEAHDAFTDGAALLRFAQVAPDVPILWDTHHTWKASGEDPAKTWRIVGKHVRYLHVKDSISVKSEKDPFTLVAPGRGEFPMAGLLEAMHGEFDGVVSLEWEKLWRPYLPSLDEALVAARETNWW